MATLSLTRLEKRYSKGESVLHGIDLEVAEGEFVVMVGPSGCGKSTTLRMIAGLEDVSGGEIRIGDRVVNNIEPKNRNIAMVFQNYAIYPHMSVYRNIAFGLHTSGLDKKEKDARIREVARILDLADLLERRPSQLSGGQRQRVAIGRAMVRNPAVFLFDEPLSNLDAQLRALMRLEIKKLHQRLGSTIVFVTHDQVEAMTLADRIVIMRDGWIQQVGTPFEVYNSPANSFVARFIGSPSMNILRGHVDEAGQVRLEKTGPVILARRPDEPRLEAGPVQIGIRPDALRVVESVQEGLIGLSGKVMVVEPLGHELHVYVDVAGREIVAKAGGRSVVDPGSEVRLAVGAEDVHLFDARTERAIGR